MVRACDRMLVLTSNDDGAFGADGGSDSVDATLDLLRTHIAALEAELAHYASRYGLTDRARELLARSVID
jgi:hypothetical protein